MNDVLEKRVKAAAVAGWWTVLIVLGFILLQWLAYLAAMSARPAWLLSLWGPNITWDFVQNVWFWGVATLKFRMFLSALVAGPGSEFLVLTWGPEWGDFPHLRVTRVSVRTRESG
jgi:hypothetical protein